MKFADLLNLYEQKKSKYKGFAYEHISTILKDAKQQHYKDFFESKTAQKAKEEGRIPDHEQSWRAFKGKNIEKLIEFIIVDEIRNIGLEVINGNSLERTTGNNLTEGLGKIKRNLLVDFGEYGSHLPDVDIVIYNPKTFKIIAVLSSKVTLRERVAQTGYWKLKLSADKVTKHIKVFFITPDEDGTLTKKKPFKKGRAIIEADTDGCYVLSETKIEVSEKVKTFDKLIEDLKKLLK
ncbi:MAG: DNA modification methylase [Chitinophagaceae bacterium]|mgnify:CR=1 FL=1|nr:DNA modification methylase [Chitinophagaceae bacterium]HMN32434.1 BsaWI family type II restriction enzyme [Chitinophagaceae bacterium]